MMMTFDADEVADADAVVMEAHAVVMDAIVLWVLLSVENSTSPSGTCHCSRQ